MSLRLLLDEDSQDKRLVRMLRLAGHEVVTVNETDFAEKGSWGGWLRMAESPTIGLFLYHTLPK